MKNIKIFMALGAFSIILLTSCNKFIDIQTSSSQVFMTTASDCQLMLDNYSKMNVGYPLDGEISSDDYYITGATYQTSATISQEEKDLYTWNATAQRLSSVPNWLNPYQVTFNANLVLETLEKLKGGSDDPLLLNTLKGSALFYRAYALWNVAQLYAKPYMSSTTNQNPGIPLKMTSDINEKSVRGTVQDTYSRILQDLTEAAGLLPNTSSISSRPNKAAAYAMLARTYLSMEDYQNAQVNANACLQIKGTLLDYNLSSVNKTSNTPFQTFSNNVEIIFHAVSYNKTSAPIAGPILASGSATNNTAKIEPTLAASYAANDLRSTVFIKPNSVTVQLDDADNPGQKKSVTLADGTFRFTGNYERTTLPTFFTGLAVDEILLIRAECYARAGNVSAAVGDLNSLLSKRWKTGTYTNLSDQLSADVVLSKILEERRKELLMRGQRWTDLRRLNKDNRFKMDIIRQTKDITFTGTTANPVKVETITMTNTLPANDPRYTLLIPKEVLDNTDIAQNQR